MKNLRSLILLISVLIVVGCGDDDNCQCLIDPVPTLDTGAVFGYVTNRWTDEAIPDVVVSTDPETEAANTDSTGLYRINDIPVAAYVLTFSKGGYLPVQRLVGVEDGRVSSLSVRLTSDEPDSLRLLAVISTGGGTNGIAVRERIAFALGDAGLQIFDLTEPTESTMIGQVWLSSSYIGDVEVHGDVAYVANNNPTVDVVDISILTTPTLGAPVTVGGKTHDLELDGDLLIVAADDSLVILDITSPLTPTRLGAVATAQDGLQQGNFGVVLDRQQKLAIVSSYNNGVEVVEYSDPAHPQLIGTYGSNMNPYDAFLDTMNSLAVIAEDDGLEILSYAQPNNLQELGTWYPGGNGGHDVKVVGSLAIFAMTFNGLRVVNISDPGNIWERQRFGTAEIGSPRNISVEDDRAYVAADNKLAILALPGS